jgi:hypothetical protein
MDKKVLLRLGEFVMPEAPTVQLNNGSYCIPQHYLTYKHTLQSVEALICDIEYDERYVVFAAQEASEIYIQIGVVGHDNYQKKSAQKDLKLLFGRKWRVEPELPTSEIIQSVFLAIKKAREHEVRELFKLTLNGSVTTPFNTHIDLPLMADQYEKKQHFTGNLNLNNQQPTSAENINHILSHLSYDHSYFSLHHIEQRNNGLWLVDIEVNRTKNSTLPETENHIIYMQLNELTLNSLSRALMRELVLMSDLHVDKHFSYRGFNRFNPDINIADIADLSQQGRKHELAAHFASEFSKTNYEVDQKRIPRVLPGKLAQKNSTIIEKFKLSDNPAYS